MIIQITASTLCDLCAPHFTYEAAEAICDYFDECGVGINSVPSIGDICISFSEIPADWHDEYDEDAIIAELDNGNILVAQ